MSSKISKFCFVPIIIAGLPLLAFAQFGQTTMILSAFKFQITKLVPITFALALLFFFWGVAKYVWSEGTSKESGRKIMIWGVVALFVMASVWGLVEFIQTALLIPGGNPGNITIPTFK
jgi:hypothetical protein